MLVSTTKKKFSENEPELCGRKTQMALKKKIPLRSLLLKKDKFGCVGSPDDINLAGFRHCIS